MIKYLIVGLVAIGLLSGCQEDTPVAKYKGEILSMDYGNNEAEVVYQTNDGKYHEETYDFDENIQLRTFHINQKIVCYVRNDGYVQEIAKE